MRRDAARGIDGLELAQQIARLREGRGGRRIEPGASCAASDGAPAAELERQGREIRVQDFRGGLRCERGLRAFGPQAVADARRSSGRRGRGADRPRPAIPCR